MRESRIESALREGVEALGGECYKFVSPGRRGVPDRIVYLPHPQVAGAFVRVHVELKAPGETLKPWQAREHARLRRLGERVIVIDSLEGVAEFLGKKVLTREERIEAVLAAAGAPPISEVVKPNPIYDAIKWRKP